MPGVRAVLTADDLPPMAEGGMRAVRPRARRRGGVAAAGAPAGPPPSGAPAAAIPPGGAGGGSGRRASRRWPSTNTASRFQWRRAQPPRRAVAVPRRCRPREPRSPSNPRSPTSRCSKASRFSPWPPWTKATAVAAIGKIKGGVRAVAVCPRSAGESASRRAERPAAGQRRGGQSVHGQQTRRTEVDRGDFAEAKAGRIADGADGHGTGRRG